MQKLARRDVLRGTGVVALAAGVAVLPFTSTAKAEGASEDQIKTLWERYIEAECESTRLSVWQDHVGVITRNGYAALETPWTPVTKGIEEISNNYEDVPLKTYDIVLRRGPRVLFKQDDNGQWTVLEFQPKALMFEDEDERHDWNPPAPRGYSYYPAPKGPDVPRWQAYPEANSGEEAYAMSVERAAGEWAAFARKRKAIARKHGLTKTEREVEHAAKRERLALKAIIAAPVTGPLSIAVKLARDIAFTFRSECDPDSGTSGIGLSPRRQRVWL